MSQDPSNNLDVSVLFTPGERLGWVFRDRNRFRRRFLEQAPVPPPPPFELLNRLQVARAKLTGRLTAGGTVGFGAVLVFGICTQLGGELGTMFAVLAVLSLLGGVGAMGGVWLHYSGLRGRAAAAQAQQQQQYWRLHAEWNERRVGFDRQDQQRVAQMLEWGAATPDQGNRRLDIVGGNLWGWEALLTVLGTSLLTTRRPTTLIDLSGEAVSRELLRVTAEHDLSVDLLLIPNELAESDLLVGLSARELVDTLIESIYSAEEGGQRSDRSMDDRILSGVCSALGDHISMARLAAALLVLMNEPGDTSALSPDERRSIADELFGDEFRRHAYGQLRRLESFIHPLTGLGTRREPRPAVDLSCLALATDGRNVRNELLNDLIVQWLIRRIAQGTAELSSLVIAGADEIPRRHLERLSDLCERRDVRLVVLFRHLRGAALQAIGGGSVGFMRLGNHEEARQAADFIGREHKFVVTQVTRTLGGNETHTLGETEGYSETEGRSFGTSRGRSTQGPLGIGGSGRNWSRNESRNWSVTRNWSQTRSVAEGSNWSEATSEQRVYEYAVEPRTLQDLPDYAMVVAQRQADGTAVVPVECNPDIISMPHLSMQPLPDVPLPPPHERLEPPTSSVPVQPAQPYPAQPYPAQPYPTQPFPPHPTWRSGQPPPWS
jgi:hypothetical protein